MVTGIRYLHRTQDGQAHVLGFSANPVAEWGPDCEGQMQAMAAAGNAYAGQGPTPEQGAAIVMGHLPPGVMGTATQALALSSNIAQAFASYNQRHAAMPNFTSHMAFAVGMQLASQAYAGTLNLHDAGSAVLTILGDIAGALQ